MSKITKKEIESGIAALTAEDFANTAGEQFGGLSDVCKIEIGTVVRVEHVEILPQQVLDPTNEPVDVWVGKIGGKEMRMPAAAIFRRQVEAACLEKGDVYLMLRVPDKYKKNDTEKKKPMMAFQVKVIERVNPVTASKRVKEFAETMAVQRAEEKAAADAIKAKVKKKR